jgi:perosamine synthetase
MTNIEAALGLAQMRQLSTFIKKKKIFNSIYKDELSKINCINFPKQYSRADSSHWLNCIYFNDMPNIEKLKTELLIKGIPAKRLFKPLTEYCPYQKYAYSGCENSYHIYNNGLCLPSSTLNSEDVIYYVCKILKSLL